MSEKTGITAEALFPPGIFPFDDPFLYEQEFQRRFGHLPGEASDPEERFVSLLEQGMNDAADLDAWLEQDALNEENSQEGQPPVDSNDDYLLEHLELTSDQLTRLDLQQEMVGMSLEQQKVMQHRYPELNLELQYPPESTATVTHFDETISARRSTSPFSSKRNSRTSSSGFNSIKVPEGLFPTLKK